jgi:hypothetical protein
MLYWGRGIVTLSFPTILWKSMPEVSLADKVKSYVVAFENYLKTLKNLQQKSGCTGDKTWDTKTNKQSREYVMYPQQIEMHSFPNPQ